MLSRINAIQKFFRQKQSETLNVALKKWLLKYGQSQMIILATQNAQNMTNVLTRKRICGLSHDVVRPMFIMLDNEFLDTCMQNGSASFNTLVWSLPPKEKYHASLKHNQQQIQLLLFIIVRVMFNKLVTYCNVAKIRKLIFAIIISNHVNTI